MFNFDGLLMKVMLTVITFSMIVVLLCGVSVYRYQLTTIHAVTENSAKTVATGLADRMADGEVDFMTYLRLFNAHHDTLRFTPDDAVDWRPWRTRFMEILARECPERTLGVNLTINDLSEEAKIAWLNYQHRWWMSEFRAFKDAAGMKYTYFIIPTGDGERVLWVIEDVLELNDDGVVIVGVLADEPRAEHERMWGALENLDSPAGYDVYDNQFGHTYAYYVPVLINGEHVGAVGVEVDADLLNEHIINEVTKVMVSLVMMFVVATFVLTMLLRFWFIRPINRLGSIVADYARRPRVDLAKLLTDEYVGGDEICKLARRIAEMIQALEQRGRELLASTETLEDVHRKATHDALTDCLNKAAYDDAILRIQGDLAVGCARFAIVAVDMNYLKRLNDTYGHDRGSEAIINLARLLTKNFPAAEVFRLGGDEFTVLVEGDAVGTVSLQAANLKAEFKTLANARGLEPWERVSAAFGVAVYDPLFDDGVDTVAKRADASMYAMKDRMHVRRTD